VQSVEERQLGRSGLWVTEVTIGTMTFANQADEREAHAILDRAYEAGVRCIDTADVYPLGGGPELRGETERIVGRWLARRGVRSEFVVATKAFGAMGPARHDRGLGRRHLMEAVDGSLARLGIDAIDLYQAHNYDPDTPLEETVRAFGDLIRSGKIRYWGVSNWRPSQVALCLGVCDRLDVPRPVSVQPRYNALFRRIEEDLVPLALEVGIGILPYNPLAGGMLTGRYRPGQEVEPGSRFALGHGAGRQYQQRYWQLPTLRVAEALAETARRAGVPLAAAALRWVLDQPGITSAIVGASRKDQLATSLQAVDLTLSRALRNRLDAAWWKLPRRDEPR
jgi:aryl-alcohol dehydrogenase-like predicted oxidoreductase